jgi:hypothetical protein
LRNLSISSFNPALNAFQPTALGLYAIQHAIEHLCHDLFEAA